MQISSGRFHRQSPLNIPLAMMRLRIVLKSSNLNWNALTRFFGVEGTEQPPIGERHLLTSYLVSLGPSASSYDPGPKSRVVGLLTTYPPHQVASKSDQNCGTSRRLKSWCLIDYSNWHEHFCCKVRWERPCPEEERSLFHLIVRPEKCSRTDEPWRQGWTHYREMQFSPGNASRSK